MGCHASALEAGEVVVALNEWSAQSLATLPTRSGFRQRGMDMTRLETFTDAAFAFAVTLLVVGGGDSIPENSEQFIDAMKRIPAFAASIRANHAVLVRTPYLESSFRFGGFGFDVLEFVADFCGSWCLSTH